MLIMSWPEWLHRRVELITFEDHDVIRRSNSFDFTVPRRALELLDAGDGTATMNVAVPLTLVRKGEMIHLNLSSEGADAIPLLSAPQLSVLAEAALRATAEIVLQTQEVPAEIVCDIRRLVQDSATFDPATSWYVGPAVDARERLFSEHEPTPEARVALRSHRIFRSLSYMFSTQYIVAVLLPTAPDSRRVAHFAYDERFYDTDGFYRRWRIILSLLRGNRARRVLIFAASPSDSASYHFEAEAPEGLQISSGKTYFENVAKTPEEKAGSFQRIHFHYSKLPRSTGLAVVLRLRPRSSTIVRGATLTSILTLLAVLYVWLQFGAITSSKGAQGAAAALLVVPILLSLYLVRTNEHPMTTHLLWPLRVVATAPGLLSFVAAGVLVGGLSSRLSGWILLTLVVLLTLSSGILGLTWLKASSRERRRDSASIGPLYETST